MKKRELENRISVVEKLTKQHAERLDELSAVKETRSSIDEQILEVRRLLKISVLQRGYSKGNAESAERAQLNIDRLTDELSRLYAGEEARRPTVFDGFWNRIKPEDPVGRNNKGTIDPPIATRTYPAEEKIKSWAGEDLPYIEKQLRDVLRVPEDQDLQKSIHQNGLTVVAVEAKTIGTETLLLLTPEGETLFKITRDKAARYSLK